MSNGFFRFTKKLFKNGLKYVLYCRWLGPNLFKLYLGSFLMLLLSPKKHENILCFFYRHIFRKQALLA